MKLNVKKLENERARLGATKTGFSRLFGLSDSAYSKIIYSKTTTFKQLTKIAEALELDPKDLLL